MSHSAKVFQLEYSNTRTLKPTFKHMNINKIMILILMMIYQLTFSQKKIIINTDEDWNKSMIASEGLKIIKGQVTPSQEKASFMVKTKSLKKMALAKKLIIKQSTIWQNWNEVENIGPPTQFNAPVMLTLGPNDYWFFAGDHLEFGGYGNYKRDKSKDTIYTNYKSKPATLKGYDIPLRTTPFKNLYDAPSGLKPSKKGYHAWHSKDMINWVHYGSVTERFSKWVTTAEYVDGKVYIYYDYPNDQDPHVYIEEDLTDGEPGFNYGLVFDDPSDGSDCGFIRDLEGHFHVIHEDWSPVDPQQHGFDSPLAGHAVSKDGLKNFKILKPAVDERTTGTGVFKYPQKQFRWKRGPASDENPKWKTYNPTYEVHTPEQNAYGDWAAISIGGQYYLFGDYDPAKTNKHKKGMSTAWFTSNSLDTKFTFCDHIGNGHPDPAICFAEGRFYLATQQETDFVSDGPWVEKVTIRVGVDTNNDGKVEQWTQWSEIKEKYDYIKGFSKQISREPAGIDLSELPKGYAFFVEVKLLDTTENKSKPIIDEIEIEF